MKHANRWILLVLVLAGFALTACSRDSASAEKIEPAHLEEIEGRDGYMIVLTERAHERLAIETDMVREEQVDGTDRMVVPYSALIYGINGETWIYVEPEPLTYMREPVTVDFIRDDMVVLVDGPAVDTVVATAGVAELYGTDTGVGK